MLNLVLSLLYFLLLYRLLVKNNINISSDCSNRITIASIKKKPNQEQIACSRLDFSVDVSYSKSSKCCCLFLGNSMISRSATARSIISSNDTKLS